jgi:hypothetical protein
MSLASQPGRIVGPCGCGIIAGQAAGGHATQERQPPRAVLAGSDVQAQDLALPSALTRCSIGSRGAAVALTSGRTMMSRASPFC